MSRIRDCVKDVVRIANRSEDFGDAKQCVEQFFLQTKAQKRGHTAMAAVA